MPNREAQQPNDTDVYLGQQLRRIRLTNGLSQEIVAESCGISFQQIQKYEHGANRISASRLFDIARVLDCSLIDLFPPADAAQALQPITKGVQNSPVNAELFRLAPVLTIEQRKTLLQIAHSFAAANKNN